METDVAIRLESPMFSHFYTHTKLLRQGSVAAESANISAALPPEKPAPVDIMGEPLSPDRVFNFPVDKPEPHPAYDFFAPGLLPGYVGNPNNNNGWIEADVPLLRELEVEADEQMVGLVIGKIVEPIVEMEDQMIALMIDAEEDIAMLFRDDDFSDDDSEGVKKEEVGGPSTTAAERQSFPLPAPGLLIPPLVIEDLSTRLGDLEYRHRQLVKKVIQGDLQIQQLQTMVSEMSSQESTLMHCIFRIDKRLTDLERRPPGPQ
nr:hypothetical protein [Tanacetum cinerariifolium]